MFHLRSLRSVVRLWALAVIAGLVVVAVSACGSSSSTSSTSANASSTPSTGAAGATSTPAPSATIHNSKLTGKTIGVLEAVNVSSNAETLQALRASAAYFGFKLEVVDANITPSNATQALATWTNQKVSAIIEFGMSAPQIEPQLGQAEKAGIPTIAIGIPIVASEYSDWTAHYTPSNTKLGEVLASYLASKYPKSTQFVTQNYPGVASLAAFVSSTASGLTAKGFTKGANYDVSQANVFSELQSSGPTLMSSSPNAKILISCCDPAPPLIVAALKASHPGVLVAGQLDDAPTLALIRQGAPVVAGIYDYVASAPIAIQSLAALWAHGTPLPKSVPDSIWKYGVVDKANVPASGLVFDPLAAVKTYAAKWPSMFNN